MHTYENAIIHFISCHQLRLPLIMILILHSHFEYKNITVWCFNLYNYHWTHIKTMYFTPSVSYHFADQEFCSKKDSPSFDWRVTNIKGTTISVTNDAFHYSFFIAFWGFRKTPWCSVTLKMIPLKCFITK